MRSITSVPDKFAIKHPNFTNVLQADQETACHALKYLITVDFACQPPRNMIFSRASPCSSKSSAAPTLKE
jgi:hypothetical protein